MAHQRPQADPETIPERLIRRTHAVLRCQRRNRDASSRSPGRPTHTTRHQVHVSLADPLSRLPRQAVHSRTRDDSGQLRGAPQKPTASREGRSAYWPALAFWLVVVCPCHIGLVGTTNSSAWKSRLSSHTWHDAHEASLERVHITRYSRSTYLQYRHAPGSKGKGWRRGGGTVLK
jgi:hypothetical protein